MEHIKHDKKSKEQPVPSQQNTDEDDVYFRFGGAVISDMVKLRYKNIQQCSAATKKDIISQEITILMTINTKNKCDMPSYLQYRDRGYMYTPMSCFIPFFREVDTCIKAVTSGNHLKQHGDEIIKVLKFN